MSGPLNVLILCEQSGTEREAFASRGHYVTSVDIAETTRPTGNYANGGQSCHVVADALDYVKGGSQGDHSWDLVIAHPMCTYLTNSGVRWLFEKDREAMSDPSLIGTVLTQRALDRWDALSNAMDFFNALKTVNTRHLAIENPIPHGHGREGGLRPIGAHNLHSYALPEGIGAPTQVVQPWMFGHTESKATAWWLTNLPALTPTNDVKAEMLALPKSETHKVHYASPGEGRWMARSTAFEGMAAAMADQWGTHVQKEVYA